MRVVGRWITGRWSVLVLYGSAGLLAVAVAGCMAINASDPAPPRESCATKADLDYLATRLPRYADPELEVELENRVSRIIYSIAYCQAAEENLR